jgi:Ca2+-binding EF-hand superfamily protein
MVQEYYREKEVQQKHEERLKIHLGVDHKISFADIDSILKQLGLQMQKRQIDQMIWEINESMDEHINYDELQLTYFRNIADTTGCEPSSFFVLLDFMIFDGSHKGYIIEDDCMEILYARHGGVNLEKEMKLLFGKKLRAEGGDGTLNLEEYFSSVLERTGRRALVF